MIEIEKTYGGKQLRIFVEDGEVLLSVRDLCRLLGDRNPNRKLRRECIRARIVCLVALRKMCRNGRERCGSV